MDEYVIPARGNVNKAGDFFRPRGRGARKAEAGGKNGRELCAAAERKGLRIMPGKAENEIRLCFAGLSEEDFLPALTILKQTTETL